MKKVAKEIDSQFDSGRRDMDVDEVFKNAGVSNKFNSAYRDNIKGYIKELNEMSKSAPRAKTGIDGVNEALEKQGSTPVKTATSVLESINSGMASIGKTALSIGGNVILDVALSYGLQKAGEAWDNYSNQQEHAIEKGNEALDNYKQTNQEMQSATSWISANEDRYVELASKATKLGEQGKLTNAEFQEYNQLSAQMAQYLPDQVTGYNSLGTAIVSVTKGTKGLNDALTTEKLLKYGEAANSASDVISKFQAEMYQDKTDFTKETGITNKLDAVKNFLDEYDNGILNPNFSGYDELTGQIVDETTKKFKANGKLTENMIDALKDAGIDGTGFFGTYTGDDLLNKDNVASLRAYAQQLESNAQSAASSIKEILPAFLQANKSYQEMIDKSPEIDSAMATMISGMGLDDIERIAGGDLNGMEPEEVTKKFRDWSNKLVTNLQDPETQEAFQNLFSIDDDKASLSFQDYEKKATDAVDAVAKKTSAFTKDELKQQSGITDSLDEMQTAYNNIADRFGKDKGFSENYVKNQLSASDMLTLGSMATDDQYKDLSYNDAIESIRNIQEKAKLSLDSMQKVVTTTTANLSTLQTATSEASSATGLSADTISSIGGVFSDIDNFDTAALFKNTASGVKLNTKALSSLLAVQHDIKSNDFARSIQEQTKAIAEQNEAVQSETKGTEAYKTEQEKLKSMLSDLSSLQQAQSQYHALYKQQQELFSDYGQWEQAQSTANAGDKYNNLVSGLKTYKDAWDKGLIGTDDFKSFAKLISPSGATDDVNFAENYAKAARYLTEDESGVKAFLNDLSSKGLADFNEESQQWSYNVKDMAEAAKQMGIGKEFMSSMFGRLEDYGFHNNVISDAEDGVLKLSDAYSNLAESEARLEDLKKNDPTNTTAIEQAEKEVTGYKQDIDELGTNLKEVASHTAENYNRELETAKSQMKTLADERDRILKSNEYGDNTQAVADYMQSQIDQLGQSYGLDSSAIQQQAEQAAKVYSDALQNATIENPVTPDFGDDTASADAYASAVDKVQQANKDNNQTLADSIKTLQEYNSEQIKGIDLFDGAYDSEQLAPAEQAMDNIVQSLGLTKEEASQLGQVLESMGIIKPEVDDSEVEQAKTTAEETKQTYDNLGDSTVSINADVSGEDSVASFVDQCSSIQQGMTTTITATVSGESEVESLESGLEQIPDNTPTTVDVTVNNQQDLDNIQSKVDSLNAGGKDITLNAHIKPDSNSEVEVKAKDTTVKVTPDPNEVEVTAKPVKVDVQPSQKEVSVSAKVTNKPTNETSQGTINYKKGSVEKADGTTSQGIINYKKGDVEKADGTVSTGIINYNLGNVATPTGMVATGVINYTLGSVAKPGKAAGTFGQSRAYAQGSLSDISLTHAFANGNVSLEQDETALVNELGMESRVRDGVWSLIPGGAHMENLKKGDIIFSAQQTKDLLKSGATPGHARAYAQGSLSDISLTHAFGGGSGWGGFGGGLANKTSVSSGSSQTDKAVQQAAKDVSGAAKTSKSTSSKQKEAIDYVEMKIDYITTKLNDYIARAERFNNYVNSNKEYAKAIKTIDELIAANKQASKTYEQKANSVAISEDIKTKVRTGAYEITEYDDATQKLITQYEKWWKKKVESDSNVNSLKEQKKDTAQKKFDSIRTYYENRRKYSESKVSTRQAELDYRENAGYSQFSSRQKYLYNQQYEQAKYQYKTIKNEASAYQKQIAIQLKNGTLKKNSTEWFEAQQHLQELNQELYDTKNAMVDAKKELRRLPIKKLQYALDGLTRFGDKIKNILNLKTSRGQTISDSEYRTQAANINDQINNNYKTRQKLLKEQKNYEYGSTEWNDLADQIYECDNNIISLEQDLDDVKRSMLDMHFKPLDDFKDKIDQSLTELDFLRNMLNEIKVDSKGNLTDAGYADIALIAQEMKLNKQTIAEYTEGLKKLQASKDQFVSEDEYNEKWKEYTEIIRDAASANHDLTGELVDMYIDGLEKQNDALQDNIDKQIEALKKKKDYWDYDKNIRKQTSEIQALEAQAAALEGVTDAASKAKLAKIKADIKDKQDDLDDTVRDHDIEFRTDSLNDFADDAKDVLDKLTENIKSSTEEQQKIVDAMLGTLTTNYDTAYKTINATIKNTGVVMSDTTSGMVSNLDSVTGAVGLVKDAMKSLAETMSEVAKNISTSFPNLNTDSNGKTTNKATDSANSMTDETNGNSNTNKNDSNVQASNTATSIKFKKKTVDGYVDTKVTLKYDITPKNATVMLQWKSSNTSAVTVSSKGVIVGKKAGSTAKITVTDTVSGKSDTCTVKVQKTIAVLEPADGKTNTSNSSGGSSDIFKGLSKDTSNKGNNSLNKNVSIADSLAYLGYAPTLANQRLLYSNLKGSGTYTGTASQNTWLLQQLRKKGYANGTKNVPLDGLYEVGEEGSELIVNKQGILIAGLEAGDGVIPHDLTQNLWQLATEGMPSRHNEPSTILDYVGSSGDVDNSVNTNNMSNVINITIEGNADAQTVEQLRGVAQSLLNDRKFVDGMIGKFDKKVSKDASKAGVARRIRS